MIVIILKKTKNRPEYAEDKKVLFLYPLTLFLSWSLFYLVILIDYMKDLKLYSNYFYYLENSMFNLSGFFNSIVYGYLSIN